jgi:hypothetical protein
MSPLQHYNFLGFFCWHKFSLEMFLMGDCIFEYSLSLWVATSKNIRDTNLQLFVIKIGLS